MAEVKPNAKQLKRNGIKTAETGFLDFLLIALDQNIDTYPAIPELTQDLGYEAYATATGEFTIQTPLEGLPEGQNGVGLVWQYIKIKKNSLKFSYKPLGNLADSSAKEATITFSFDSDVEALGFREMYKRADLQIILPTNDRRQLWVGRENSPCNLSDFTDEQGIEKNSGDVMIQGGRFSPLYLYTPLVVY